MKNSLYNGPQSQHPAANYFSDLISYCSSSSSLPSSYTGLLILSQTHQAVTISEPLPSMGSLCGTVFYQYPPFIFLHFLQIYLFNCQLLHEASLDYTVCNSILLIPWLSFPPHSNFSLESLTPSDTLYIYFFYYLSPPIRI